MNNNICKILHFTTVPRRPVRLPMFLGSALRGVMGRCLMEDSQEVYSALFSRVDIATGDTPPNPYVIYHAGLMPRQPGDQLCFDVKLFGEAARYASHVILAMTDGCAAGLGAERHPFDVVSVIDEDIPVFEPAKTIVTEKIGLVFDTPLQIRTHKEGVMWTLNFNLLLSNILRRLKMLEITETSPEYAEILLQKAKEIRIARNSLKPHYMERWSNRTASRKSLSGLVGEICFEGSITRYMPYLRAGSLLQLGKACTMGLGHFYLQDC